MKSIQITLVIVLLFILQSMSLSAFDFGSVFRTEKIAPGKNARKKTTKASQFTPKNNSLILYSLLTQRGLEKAEQYFDMGWPWRRKYLGKTMDFLNQCGAKVIAVDAIFTERSVYRTIEQPDENGCYRAEDDDLLFAQALEKIDNSILGTVFFITEKDLNDYLQRSKEKWSKFSDKKLKRMAIKYNISILNYDKYRILDDLVINSRKKYIEKNKKKYKDFINTYAISLIRSKDKDTVSLPKYYSTILPYKTYLNTSRYLASINTPVDNDLIIRRTPLLIKFLDSYFPSFSFASYLTYIDFDPKKEKIRLEKNYLIVRKQKIPLDKNGYFVVKWYGKLSDEDSPYDQIEDIDILTLQDKAEKLYSLYQKNIKKPNFPIRALYQDYSKYQNLLQTVRKKLGDQKTKHFSLSSSEKKVINADIEGKVVILGDQIPAHGDIRPTPLSKREIGVHVHGTAIDNLIQGDF